MLAVTDNEYKFWYQERCAAVIPKNVGGILLELSSGESTGLF